MITEQKKTQYEEAIKRLHDDNCVGDFKYLNVAVTFGVLSPDGTLSFSSMKYTDLDQVINGK